MNQMERTHGLFDEAMETRPRAERQVNHQRQVMEIIRHAHANCQAVRQRFKQIGLMPEDIGGVADLVKIPVLHKDELIELQKNNPPFGGLLGVPEEELSWIFMSPGPIFDPVMANEELRERALAAAFYCCGFRKGDKVLNTWSYHMVPAGMWNDLALRYMGCTVIPACLCVARRQAQAGIQSLRNQLKILDSRSPIRSRTSFTGMT